MELFNAMFLPSPFKSTVEIGRTYFLMNFQHILGFPKWVDSSKRRNNAENLMLLNKSFDVIK